MFRKKKAKPDIQLADFAPPIEFAPEKYLLAELKKNPADWTFITTQMRQHGRGKLTQHGLNILLTTALQQDAPAIVFQILLEFNASATPEILALTFPLQRHETLKLFLEHDRTVSNDAALVEAAKKANWQWVNIYLLARNVSDTLLADLLAAALLQTNLKQTRILIAAGADIDQLKILSLIPDTECDVKDTMNQWLAAKIIARQGNSVHVHYLDWPTRWDEWIDISETPERFAASKTRAGSAPEMLLAADWKYHWRITFLKAQSANDWQFVVAKLPQLFAAQELADTFIDALIAKAIETAVANVVSQLERLRSHKTLGSNIYALFKQSLGMVSQLSTATLDALGLNYRCENIDKAFQDNSPAQLREILANNKNIQSHDSLVIAAAYGHWLCVQAYLDFRDPGPAKLSRIIIYALTASNIPQLDQLFARRTGNYAGSYLAAANLVRDWAISKKHLDHIQKLLRDYQVSPDSGFILAANTAADWKFACDYLQHFPEANPAPDFLPTILMRAIETHPASVRRLVDIFAQPLQDKLALEEQYLLQELLYYYDLRLKENLHPSFLRRIHKPTFSGNDKTLAALKMIVLLLTGHNTLSNTDYAALQDGRLSKVMRLGENIPASSVRARAVQPR